MSVNNEENIQIEHQEIVRNGNGFIKTEPMPKSIATAVNGVMSDIRMLAKGDENKFQNYNYASIDKFLSAVNPLCAKHGLIITMDEESCKVSRDGAKNPWIHIVYRFILSHKSGETWSYRPRRNMFVSMTGGQSMGSAMSYTLKQFMRSLFQISTGEKDDLDGHNQDFDKKKEEKGDANGTKTQTTNRRRD
tara:strand:+ start:424 stop:996 length:573 start_codon:yes stop_codon:yes gene_type:complete